MNGKDPLILGMDGGGTDTTTWIADSEGRVLGRGHSGPSNIKAVGANAARNSLDLSILAAFRDAGMEVGPVEVSCLGLAGFDRPRDREWLNQWASESAWARRLVLVNDGDLVVAAGTPEGWGVGVIAGTGSIAVGRDRAGKKSRAGGWGYIISDEGSAFAVSVAALRRIVRRTDGRDPVPADDPLTRRVFRALGIAGVDELIAAVYGEGIDRSRLAGLARVVVESAEDDPTIVDQIIAPAAHELAEMASAVARNLDWHGGPLPLAMGGGFLLNCPGMREGLVGHLQAEGYEVEARAVPEPVRGALVLARRELVE
jgi:N-acetylglucosamine kinase-like BadF-type ATPase